MKSIIERSWITAVFSTFGAIGVIGLLVREFFAFDLNLNVPLAAMMIVSGVFGLIAMYQLRSGNAEPGSEWGNHPWSNFCFGIGLIGLGTLLLLQNNINAVLFTVLAVCSLMFVIGLYIENNYSQQVAEN